MIDRTALSRAADHARAALAYVDLAKAIEVPTVFGRRAANAEIRLSMDLVASSTGNALAELGDDAILIDSRRAIQTLQHLASEIRDRGAPVSSRGSAAFTDAIAGVKLHAATIEHVAKLAGARGAVPPEQVHIPTLRAAVAELSGDMWRVPPWLAEASQPRWIDPVSYRSIDAAIQLRSAGEVATEVRRLIRPTVDDQSDRMTQLAGIGQLPDAMLASLDERSRSDLRGLSRLLENPWNDEAHTEATYLVDRLWRRDVATSGVDGEQLARTLADSAPTADGARQLGLLLEHEMATLDVPESLRFHVSSSLLDVRSDREAKVLLGALHTVRSKQDAAALAAEARRLIAADELTPESLHRLRVLDALPKDLRPLQREPMLSRFDELTDAQLATLHDDLRWSVEREDFVRDVEAGSRAVIAEVTGFIERGDEPFTRADMLRLARLQELGTIRGMPQWKSDAWTFREKLSSMTSETRDVRGEMQRLRGVFERMRVDADPSITRTTQLRDLRQLLTLPDDRLDLPALEHLRAIEEVAGRKGLVLPSRLRELPTSMLADAAAGRGITPELAAELDSIRSWMATWDVSGPDDLARIAAGTGREPLPPHVLEYIGDNWDMLVTNREGITPLTNILVRRIAGADGKDPALVTSVRLANQLVRMREPATPGALRTLYDETVEAFERNLDRIDGIRTDTYDSHPDYAELGRIAANMPLLSHVPGPKPPVGPAATETLTW